MCSINHDKKAIFIHNPKTAGYYIEKILTTFYGFTLNYSIKNNGYGFDSNNIDYPFLPIDNRGVINYYMNNNDFNLKNNMCVEKWISYKKIAFVRNPYERFISAYEYIKKKYQQTFPNDIISFPNINKFIEIQKTGFDNILYEKKHFLLFFHYYHAFIIEKEHIFMHKDSYNKNYFIGRFENINDDLINALEFIGEKNKYKHIDFVKGNICFNVSNKLDYDNYFEDNKILQFVNTYFQIDFYKFGYSIINDVTELKKNIILNTKEFMLSNNNMFLIKYYQKKNIIDLLNNINILDNFFDQTDIQIMQYIIKNKKWVYGHKSHANNINENIFFSIDLHDNLFFFEYLKDKIELYFNVTIKISRVYANGQPHGQNGCFHKDSDNVNEITFCVYLTEYNEDYDYGGYLMIKHPEDNFIRSIEPKCGRCVFFPGTFEHKGNSFYPDLKNMRICVALKFEIVL
jgi:hypothetical protein